MDRREAQQLHATPRAAAPLTGEALRRLADELDAAVTPARAPLGGLQSELDAVLSRANVGVVHRDMAGRVLAVNERFCELAGRDRAALDGLPLAGIVHPDDLADVTAGYAAALAAGEPYEKQTRYVRPDGSVIWCATHVSLVKDADGRVVSALTVAQDVTARLAAERELREREEHYRHTVELAPQISWTAAPDGAIIDASSRWTEVTGNPVSTALGEQWRGALLADDVPATDAAWQRSLATGEPVDVEYRLRTATGEYRWFRGRAAPRRDEAGRVLRWYGTLEDIHDRKVMADALRESEERFRLAAQAAGLGVWDYDATIDRREWSDEFKAMLGLDVSTRPAIETALARVVPEDRHLLQALVSAADARDSNHPFDVTLRIRRADNDEERWIRTAGWRMQAPSGRLSRVIVTMRDVTEERTAEERVRWTARHDALTRLPNRGYFTERLERAITAAGQGGERLALVLFDVDHLKDANDTIGHDAGDLLLRSFADRLRQALPAPAVIGRVGGDEFAAFLPMTDGEEATLARVAAALAALRDPFTYQGYTLDCQATAGAALFPQHGESATDLLKSADLALYDGKAGQRGSLHQFRSEMRAGLQRRSSMLNIAREAVRDDRVFPYYQPKVALATGQVAGFEALLRWRHPHFGIQAPDTIAAAFEDFDLSLALGERILERVFADMRGWLDRGVDVGRIAVNLSPAEFRHEGLAARILDRLAAAGLPASMLELEITETVFLGRGAEAVGQMLETLHRAGVRIALDDFGTGYASLRHLKAFPVDVIKIDRSFVANLAADADDAAIVDAVVGLGQRMGMEVVAEGVETAAQAAYLVARGCTHAQGYLYGRAMPAGQVEAMLAPGAVRALG